MKKFVLDCSVVMSWCFEDEKSRLSEKILEYLSDNQAIVPEHWPLEVANVLLVAERKKRIFRTDTERFLSILSFLPISIDTDTQKVAFTNILSIARDNKLSSYDAAYLELAMREGLELATFDILLKNAAVRVGLSVIH